MYRRTPTKVGAGIGALGALFVLLTTTLLVVMPQELLPSVASTAYVETWSRPIMAVGGFVFSIGIPLTCAGSAYHLATNDHAPKSVVAGFLVGGFVFVVANAILGVTVTHFFAYGSGLEQSLLGHAENSIPHGLRLFGGGLLGVVGAIAVEEYV